MISTKLQKAIKVLSDSLKEDTKEGSYYYAWQANIAMSYIDNERWYKDKTKKKSLNIKDKHIIANNAAKYFLDLLIKK